MTRHPAATCCLCGQRGEAVPARAGWTCLPCVSDAVDIKLDKWAGAKLAEQKKDTA